MAVRIIQDLNNYSCPLCLEIFDNPSALPCGHCFCQSCIKNDKHKLCPVCRREFSKSSIKSNELMNNLLNELITLCAGCQEEVVLIEVRMHNATCDSLKQIEQNNLKMLKVQPDELLSKENRSTFSCPFCKLRHLDNAQLIDHCNRLHRKDTTPVVCPICASMPWSDPHYFSTNFIAHLNMRHQFEYDTYVDFEKNDEDMLKQALEKSMDEN